MYTVLLFKIGLPVKQKGPRAKHLACLSGGQAWRSIHLYKKEHKKRHARRVLRCVNKLRDSMHERRTRAVFAQDKHACGYPARRGILFSGKHSLQRPAQNFTPSAFQTSYILVYSMQKSKTGLCTGKMVRFFCPCPGQRGIDISPDFLYPVKE